MFADDTNLFYSHKDLKLLFKIVMKLSNNEQVKTNNWFKANKLSLGDNTNYIFFHRAKPSSKITHIKTQQLCYKKRTLK